MGLKEKLDVVRSDLNDCLADYQNKKAVDAIGDIHHAIEVLAEIEEEIIENPDSEGRWLL